MCSLVYLAFDVVAEGTGGRHGVVLEHGLHRLVEFAKKERESFVKTQGGHNALYGTTAQQQYMHAGGGTLLLYVTYPRAGEHDEGARTYNPASCVLVRNTAAALLQCSCYPWNGKKNY